MDQKQFIQILKKYQQGTASPEERKFIEAYYNLFETAPADEAGLEDNIKEELLQKVWAKIHEGKKERDPKTKRLFPRMAKIAAAILVLLASGVTVFSLLHRAKITRVAVTNKVEVPGGESIHPGGNKAILTLGNGRQVVLDSAKEGSLARQGNTKVIKLNNGKLFYQQQGEKNIAAARDQTVVEYNTLTTPRGGQYQVVLPDGSKVWLNAASSLRFPTAFNGSTRSVEVTGEAYFEIAPQADKPFIVQAGKVHVRVLGTYFDVNAYAEEESIKTTLSEGAVKVVPVWDGGQGAGIMLRPGEQASLNKETGRVQVKPVNVESVFAWKNGLFYFDNTNIQTIMQEVSRWYNVDVRYETTRLENKNFSGVLSRYGEVSDLLERLELTGTVHFTIVGKTIVVAD